MTILQVGWYAYMHSMGKVSSTTYKYVLQHVVVIRVATDKVMDCIVRYCLSVSLIPCLAVH